MSNNGEDKRKHDPKTGRYVNTAGYDWLDEKDRQIQARRNQADQKNVGRLTEKADIESQRKELKSKLISGETYQDKEDYTELQREYSYFRNEYDKNQEEEKRLRKIKEKGSKVDKEALLKETGDAQFVKEYGFMFAEKTPEAQKASERLLELYKRDERLTERLDKISDKMRAIDKKNSIQQKATWKEKFDKPKSEYKEFDTKTYIPYYDDLLEKGQAKIVEMSPKMYLECCAYKIFQNSTYERQVNSVVGDANVVYHLADLMSGGTKMYMPMLNYREKQQEGRHRAAAAILQGVDKIPVLLVK